MSQIDPTILYYHLILFILLSYCFSYYMFIMMENYVLWINLINSENNLKSIQHTSQDHNTYKTILNR